MRYGQTLIESREWETRLATARCQMAQTAGKDINFARVRELHAELTALRPRVPDITQTYKSALDRHQRGIVDVEIKPRNIFSLGLAPNREAKNLATETGRAIEVDERSRTIYGLFATWKTDRIGDVIQRGAFADTIRERGPRKASDGTITSRIKCDLNHSHIIGLPVRLWEDSIGAWYEARIDRTPIGDLVLERIISKSLDMNSFVFDILEKEAITGGRPEVIDGGYTVTPTRRLTKLRLHAVGPVDFPCSESAVIYGLLPGKAVTAETSDYKRMMLEAEERGRQRVLCYDDAELLHALRQCRKSLTA